MARRNADAGAPDPNVVLGLLSAVENDSAVTQRDLARDLGIALGLTNAYLRRCVRKGLVKIRQAPLNRYAYYLTPRGFAEKSRLTAEYLAASLDFFRVARRDFARVFETCVNRGWRRLALAGASELAEIAVLGLHDIEIQVFGIIDPDGGASYCGLRVVPDLAAALQECGKDGLDAIIMTDMRAPQERFDALIAEAACKGIPAERILAPDLLRISLQARPNGKGSAR